MVHVALPRALPWWCLHWLMPVSYLVASSADQTLRTEAAQFGEWPPVLGKQDQLLPKRHCTNLLPPIRRLLAADRATGMTEPPAQVPAAPINPVRC